MKKLALAALIAMSSPASAAISDGIWKSDDGEILIGFNGMGFTRYVADTDYVYDCQIVEWPVSSPVAIAECPTGDRHNVEIHMDAVIFDGVPLTQSLEAFD